MQQDIKLCLDGTVERSVAKGHHGNCRAHTINIFNVLGSIWDPTDKKFSSVSSYRQDLLPTCKAFLRKPPHAFGSQKVTIVQQSCRLNDVT